MIDIIIAVNSINESITKCIDAVVACTDLNRNRLLLVAYGNNIEGVTAGLTSYNNFHTVILRAENSHSAISAMEAGASFGEKNDVILLDTDVIVTPDWIEKIIFDVAKRPEIATVSPVVVREESVNQVCFSPSYSHTNSPSDLCVFIPRKVIDLIGDLASVSFFDRCVAAGLCHYQADDAIVYVGKIPQKDDRTAILYVLGCEASLEEKAYYDKWQFLSVLLPPMMKMHKVYCAVRIEDELVIYSKEEDFEYRFSMCVPIEAPVISVKEYKDIWNSVLRALSIDIVHVIDVRGIGVDVYDVAKELQIPVYSSAFDYGFICPNNKLLRPSGTSCYLAAPKEMCDSCIQRSCRILAKGDYLKWYQDEYAEALSVSEAIFVPSMSMKYYMGKAYPGISNKLVTLVPGIETDSERSSLCVVEGKNTKAQENLIRVGYFNIERQQDIAYHGGSRVASLLQRIIEVTELVDVTYVGVDEIDEETSSKIDVLLYLPNWPVAYGMIVSQSVKYGIPIITVETGAIAERMQQYTHGFTVPSDDVVRGVRDTLISIAENPEVLLQKKVLAGHSYIKNAGEMIEEFEIYYETHTKIRRSHIFYEGVDDRLLAGAKRSVSSDLVPQKESIGKRIMRHLMSSDD